jgi:hypothetical protein
VNQTQLALLLFLAALLPALYLAGRRVQSGHYPDLRPILAFEALRGITARAIETGRAVHVSLGLEGITSDSTADSLAGLMVLRYLAEQSAATGTPPIVTLANPTLLFLAQDVVRRQHGVQGEEAALAARQVRWIAPEPAAYAAGVMGVLGGEAVDANVMVGSFGSEYLLMGEAAVRNKMTHVGGTSDPNVLPFVYASADYTLLGEEIYAARAYLEGNPWHIGSLLAQDLLRWVIVVVVIGLVIFNTAF